MASFWHRGSIVFLDGKPDGVTAALDSIQLKFAVNHAVIRARTSIERSHTNSQNQGIIYCIDPTIGRDVAAQRLYGIYG